MFRQMECKVVLESMTRKCIEKSCLHHTECERYFEDQNLTDFKKSKSATGEELCVFHWGVGFMRAMKKCAAEQGYSEEQPT
jgi:hypothetical protein